MIACVLISSGSVIEYSKCNKVKVIVVVKLEINVRLECNKEFHFYHLKKHKSNTYFYATALRFDSSMYNLNRY